MIKLPATDPNFLNLKVKTDFVTCHARMIIISVVQIMHTKKTNREKATFEHNLWFPVV